MTIIQTFRVFFSSRDLFQFWHWQLSFLELCTFWLMLQRTAKNDSSYDHYWLWQCGKVWRVASTPNAALLRWSEDHSKRGNNDSQLTRDERADNFKAYDWSTERYFCSDWLKWVNFLPLFSITFLGFHLGSLRLRQSPETQHESEVFIGIIIVACIL